MACFSFSLHYQDILAILFSKSYLVSSVHVTGWISPSVEIALYSAFFSYAKYDFLWEKYPELVHKITCINNVKMS